MLGALEDYATPRVQTHAGAALVNFSEQCPKAVLIKYLPLIADKMQKVLAVRLEEVRPHNKQCNRMFSPSCCPWPLLCYPGPTSVIPLSPS